MSELTNEQLKAVANLYTQSAKFQNLVNTFIRDEASRALKQAEVLKSFTASDEKPSKEVKIAKRAGRPKGSKNKPKTNGTTEQTNGNSEQTETKVTHADAISHVLASSSEKNLSSKGIYEALQAVNLPGYSPPNNSTLLSVLSALKTKNRIKVSGSPPNSRYSLV